MMREPAKSNRDVPSLLRELEAARSRVVQMQTASRGADVALRAYALCDEVERLCQQAAVAGDRKRVKASLSTARRHLNELQKLLGVH